jgi:hypothetical protein
MRRLIRMTLIISMYKACCAFDGLISLSNTTFQVLRLPWMAEVSQSVGNRCDRLPWMAEVSQSVGNRCDRLPWMAAEIAPGNPRHFLHPWRSEVLEPPGAAPVKTWKVCHS